MARWHRITLACEAGDCDTEVFVTQRDTPGAACPSFINLEKKAKALGWRVKKNKTGMTHWCPRHAAIFDQKIRVEGRLADSLP